MKLAELEKGGRYLLKRPRISNLETIKDNVVEYIKPHPDHRAMAVVRIVDGDLAGKVVPANLGTLFRLDPTAQ